MEQQLNGKYNPDDSPIHFECQNHELAFCDYFWHETSYKTTKVEEVPVKEGNWVNPQLKVTNQTDMSKIRIYSIDDTSNKIGPIKVKSDNKSAKCEKIEVEYIDKNNEALTSSKAKYDEMLTALKNNDWKYFANKELDSLNTQIEELNALIAQDSENDDLKTQLKSLELQKEVVNLRLDKNINYGSDNYKSIAVQNYRMYMGNYIQSSQGKNLTDDEKSEINGYLEKANLYKYDLYNDTEYQNTATANYTFQNSIGTYIAIIVMVVVIVAGVSISEEFNKGTVKLLLVRPYSRTKILISKLIAVFITMLITTATILLLQFIIGGIVYGFGTYMMNVVQFDFTTNSIVTLNIFAYLGLIFICKLPIFILIGTLAFALSTLFLNSPLAVALPILGYMGSDMINMIAISYKWDWVKYFVTPNWDLSQYLFGGTPMFNGISIEFSITICAIYFAIMLVASIVSFKKRNIKNI